ncbi:response regulator [Patescibacteria group bacterium]|nr:response regulator [Patescibacteria group bacterium]
MPERARVFVVEDSQDWLKTITGLLEDDGHDVVLTAKSREEALASIPKLRDLKIQVATLDGNLSPLEYGGTDGQIILKAMRDGMPELKVIGVTGGRIDGADVNVWKGDSSDLGKIVTNL